MILYGRGFLALAIMTFATSFNGWPLDVPPNNALFWMFGGVALAMHHLAPPVEQAAAEPPPPPTLDSIPVATPPSIANAA